MLRSLAEDVKWRVVALMEGYVLQDPRPLSPSRPASRIVDVLQRIGIQNHHVAVFPCTTEPSLPSRRAISAAHNVDDCSA